MRIENCPDVYEPDDDSYLLMGIEEIKGSLIEIGSGTGIVGLSYAERGVKVTMIDISEKAVRCAFKNSLMNGIGANVIRANLFDGIRGRFNFCIFNPPYLPEGFPDDGSWTGGKVGNEVTIAFLKSFEQFADIAFYIESSLSTVRKETFERLKFEAVRKIEYDSETLRLMKVSEDALHR